MTEEAPAPRGGPLRRFFMKHPWGCAIAFGLVFLPAIRPLLRRVPDPPQVHGFLPEFRLTGADGRLVTLGAFRGQVFVVGFTFTSCGIACASTDEALGELARRFADRAVPVDVVALTVDPETDTPEVLRAWLPRLGTGTARVRPLTGAAEAVRALVVDGFRVRLGEKTVGPGGRPQIPHSDRLVLVDGLGRIRGYYGTGPLGVDEVFHRARHVLDQGSDP